LGGSGLRVVNSNGKVRYQYEPLIEGERECRVCTKVKPVTEFVVDIYLKGGRTRDCKECRAQRFRGPNKAWKDKNPQAVERYKEANRGTTGWKYRIKYNYGITPEEYHAQFEFQEGKCAICGKEIEVIDHDHTTNDLRGLLCQRCNRGLGHFDDRIDLLRSALKYLEEDGVWLKVDARKL
jgi:hypothetical protein